MLTNYRCLLDMDGVLVDFIAGACKAHGVPNPYGVDPKAAGVWHLDEYLRMTPEAFWAPLDSKEFWESLEWMPDGKEILELAERTFGRENVAILSSPSSSVWCMAGKHAWIKQHMPAYARRFLFGTCKEFCAQRNNVLIDDSDSNVKKFRDAGGYAIRAWRHWNSGYPYLSASSVLEHLEYQLRGLATG